MESSCEKSAGNPQLDNPQIDLRSHLGESLADETPHVFFTDGCQNSFPMVNDTLRKVLDILESLTWLTYLEMVQTSKKVLESGILSKKEWNK